MDNLLHFLFSFWYNYSVEKSTTDLALYFNAPHRAMSRKICRSVWGFNFTQVKNKRKMTFEESGETIMPYTSLPTNKKICNQHDFRIKSDMYNHTWSQCELCGEIK